jgi:hypothetical protein
MFTAIAALALGCGSPSKQRPLSDHAQPLSVAEHTDEAQRHDAEAAREASSYDPERGRSTASPRCYDDPIAGQSTSGGKPLEILRPCWSSVSNPTAIHLETAERDRREAEAHRARAAELIGAEKRACAGLGANAIAHSPFFHREDIRRVEPIRDRSGAVRGARALFAAVPGLTVDWLERATRCHQARAAVMGYSPTFMSYCPLVVAPSRISVAESDEGLWIEIESAAAGELIWARARALRPESPE